MEDNTLKLSNRIKELSTTKSEKSTKQQIIEWFKKNPNPKDDQIHALAEKMGIDKHKFESIIYSIVTDYVDGLR